jgi:pimeloyl-ACP methyl ester carboxylesterase
MSNSSVKEQGYFRTRDGVRLYYAAEGPKDGEPLVFCYGLVCSKLQWKYQMEEFRKTHRVYYMDYRGHGQSARPADASSMTIENLALDLVEFFDEVGLPSATVLGHSLGVNIVLDLYRLAPVRVRGLVLANGTPKDPFETMFHHNFLQVAFPAIRMAHGLFPDLLQKFWQSQGKNPINQEFIALAGFNPKYAKREDINEYLRITSTVDLDIFLGLLDDFMRTDATHWLHEVKAPALVLGGERDLITPLKNQRIFAELIPGAELVVVPEGSHCPQMEKADLVNEIIGGFLARMEQGASAARARAAGPAAKAKRGKTGNTKVKPGRARAESAEKRNRARPRKKLFY